MVSFYIRGEAFDPDPFRQFVPMIFKSLFLLVPDRPGFTTGHLPPAYSSLLLPAVNRQV